MITRRWSQWVFAEYADDDGNLFGGDLLRVVDSRETVVATGVSAGFAPVFGYDGEAPGGSATATKRPAGLDPDTADRSPA